MTVKPLRCLMALVLLSAGGVRADDPGFLLGVSVDRIWRTANFLNVNIMLDTPTFSESGSDYSGSTSMNAHRPGNPDETIGMSMSWTVSVLDDERRFLGQHFTVPANAIFVVTGRFTDEATTSTVETYTVLVQSGQRLSPHNLGLTLPSGKVVVEDHLGAAVFQALGIEGIQTTLSLPPIE